jgi:hypothetical protein
MQKKQSEPAKSTSRVVQEIRDNLKSFKPVVRAGWAIKFSIHKECNVLLLFTSLHTGQTILRYFGDEESAVEYVNWLTDRDASEEFNF